MLMGRGEACLCCWARQRGHSQRKPDYGWWNINRNRQAGRNKKTNGERRGGSCGLCGVGSDRNVPVARFAQSGCTLGATLPACVCGVGVGVGGG